jgi:hypothetical protein
MSDNCSRCGRSPRFSLILKTRCNDGVERRLCCYCIEQMDSVCDRSSPFVPAPVAPLPEARMRTMPYPSGPVFITRELDHARMMAVTRHR